MCNGAIVKQNVIMALFFILGTEEVGNSQIL